MAVHRVVIWCDTGTSKVLHNECNRIPVPQDRTVAFLQIVDYSRPFHVATIVHDVVHTMYGHMWTPVYTMIPVYTWYHVSDCGHGVNLC